MPVHPVVRHLLATCWKGQLYVDGALPFGLRSAPKFFTALADAFEFINKQHGVECVWHYLDNFITIGHDWRGKQILAKSDNESAVHVIKHRSCKDETLMHMLRCLFFIEAHFRFTLVAEHPGCAQ